MLTGFIVGGNIVGVLWVCVELFFIYIEALGISIGRYELEVLGEAFLKFSLYRIVIFSELIFVALDCAVDKGKGFTGGLRIGSHILGKVSIVINCSPQTPAYRTHVSKLQSGAVVEFALTTEVILRGIRDLTVRISGAAEDWSSPSRNDAAEGGLSRKVLGTCRLRPEGMVCPPAGQLPRASCASLVKAL